MNSNLSSPLFMRGSLGKSLSFNEGIKLSNKLTTSLKVAIDNLDLVPELDERALEEEKLKKENEINIFKNLRNKRNYKFRSISDLEEINKFNFSIVNNKKWGSESLNIKKNDNKLMTVKKPTKSTLAKEIGKNYIFKF